MTIRALRLLIVAAALLALAPAVGSAGVGGEQRDRGVIQAVDAGQIVLRALDGGVARFEVTPRTRVWLNGSPSSVGDLRPGLVAEVVYQRNGRAVRIRAFGAQATTVDRGVVTALTKTSISVTTSGGGSVTIGLDRTTRFRFLGVSAPRSVARSGAIVAVTHGPSGPATIVNVLKRARA